jgi:hypothetical protein
MKYTSSLGSCLCGDTQYELLEEPLTLYACHCTDCQTASGSSCTLIMRMPTDGVRVRAGNPQPFERSRADGKKKLIYRCPRCLTALWGAHTTGRDYISLYAGTMDNSSLLAPIGHIWTDSAQPWVIIPDGTIRFGKQPTDMSLFEEAWHRANA